MYRFVISCLRPVRFWLLGLGGIACIWAVHTNVLPYLLKRILNSLGSVERIEAGPALLYPICAYLGSGLLVSLGLRCHDYIWLRINPLLKQSIADKLMLRMMGHSQAFYQDHLAGDLSHKVKSVMKGLPDLLKLSIDSFLRNTLVILGASCSLAHIHPSFSLALGVWIVCFLLGSILFLKKGKRLSVEAASSLSAVFGHIGDMIGGMINVTLFSNQSYEAKRMAQGLQVCEAKEKARDWFFLKLYFFQGLSFVVYQAFCFTLLVQGFKKGSISTGDFGLLAMLNISIVNFLWKLSDDIGSFVRVLGEVSQGLNLILKPIEVKDLPAAPSLSVSQGEVWFERVSFGYPGQMVLFDQLSLRILSGQKVGLVGYSGSGKSSLLKLLLRFYEPQSGRILIDGQDISYVSQASLLQHISIIPQEPVLFHRSIEENIRYGRLDASEEDLLQVAKGAHAHPFIEKLPQGYQALVGERGVKLSGGEKQRLALARALLKNAPILILDEATSQLDSITEAQIQSTLYKLMQGKTTLVIAHRLSTLLSMDRILVFDRGAIIQDGTHQALVLQEGLYKRLWETQVGGFLKYEFETSVV